MSEMKRDEAVRLNFKKAYRMNPKIEKFFLDSAKVLEDLIEVIPAENWYAVLLEAYTTEVCEDCGAIKTYQKACKCV